jgi:hypothetical protein
MKDEGRRTKDETEGRKRKAARAEVSAHGEHRARSGARGSFFAGPREAVPFDRLRGSLCESLDWSAEDYV